MKASEAIELLCSTLAPEIKGQHEFELALGVLIAKHRRMLRQSYETQAASLEHIGPGAIAQRQNCHRITAWRRVRRGKEIVAALSALATDP